MMRVTSESGPPQCAQVAGRGCSTLASLPACYRFGSCLRNVGVGLGQFWPVFLPVSRAQLLPRYDASRELLDGVTVLCGDGFLATAHLRHERGRHLNGFR